MATKAKVKQITAQQAEDAVRQYTEAATNLQKIESQKRMEITEVEGKYARDIEEYSQMQTAAQEILETYGKQIELDTGERKSTKILGITIGFRSGRAKLSLLEGFDWDAVHAKVKDLFPRYVRRVEQLEKDKLLKDLAGEPKKLESVGLAVEQSNNFYVKLD